MKRAINLISIILISLSMWGQNIPDRPDMVYPQESLRVHLTQTSLFPGEVMAFKIYCTNPLFPELELSRIVFIELVNDLNVPVLRKKILLEHGAGEGQFVLPADLASGIYTLLSYTNWMKNFGEKSFDKQSVLIVNPGRGLARFSDSSSRHPDNRHPGDEPPRASHTKTTSGIELTPDKEKYSTREKVSLQVKLEPEGGAFMGGSFSVSVCFTEPAFFGGQAGKYSGASGVSGISGASGASKMKTKKISSLPDYGGIRLSGKLEDASGQAMINSLVILSEPGPGTRISSTRSDKGGNFHFLLTPQEGEKDLVFTLPASDAFIKLEEPFWNGFKSPPVQAELYLDENVMSFLEEKFLHFQLQQKFNQRSFMKKEQVDLPAMDSSSFYTSYSQELKMDDYILLDSLSEYFYELVPSVRFVQSRGKFDIRVTDPIGGYPYEEKPGVFVDGVLYSDYNEIADIPVEKLEKIVVIPAVYYYGNFSFGGIVDLHTLDSDFNTVKLLPEMIRLIYPMASLPEMKFDFPNYSLPKNLNRIPDFRHLICWEPNFLIGASGENSLQFFTGDLLGDYTIRVSGITKDGRILQSESQITVGHIVE